MGREARVYPHLCGVCRGPGERVEVFSTSVTRSAEVGISRNKCFSHTKPPSGKKKESMGSQTNPYSVNHIGLLLMLRIDIISRRGFHALISIIE